MSDQNNITATENTPTTDTITATNPAIEAVKAKLAEFGASDAAINSVINDLGVEELDDLTSLEVADLTSAGMKLAKARKLLLSLNETAKQPSPSAIGTAETQVMQGGLDAILPTIPNDESWLNALKTGGVLKVDESSYIAAIRAALADKAGLYDVPASLTKAMEKYADETDEQLDPIFYSIRKSLTRRTYGDIFAAIEGLDGSFINESRRKEFLGRIRETLWPAIADSYQILDGWYQTWKAGLSDPSTVIAALNGGIRGGGLGGMMTPPDTSAIHDAGDALVTSINRVFRGTGVQVAAAMAYDANSIRNTLEDNRLPALLGVKNRELMLKKINANVSSNYVRLEKNLVKYVLAFAKHDAVTSDAEVDYFVALWQLGTQINWNELGERNTGGIKGLTGDRVL